MPNKQQYHDRPDGASTAFLRRLVDRLERFDRLHDCLDLVGYRLREDDETLIAFIIGNWEYRPEVQRLALAHPNDFRTLIALCRWYKGMTKKGREIAYTEIEREVLAMPRLADRWAVVS